MWTMVGLLGSIISVVFLIVFTAFFISAVIMDIVFYFEFSHDAKYLIKNAREKNPYLYNRLELISSEVASLFNISPPVIMVDGEMRKGFFAGVFYSHFFSKTFLFISSENISGLNDIELRGLFAHEFAHIKRRYKPFAIINRLMSGTVRMQYEEYKCDEMGARIVGKEAMLLCFTKLGSKLALMIQAKPHIYANKTNVGVMKDLVFRIQKINRLNIK